MRGAAACPGGRDHEEKVLGVPEGIDEEGGIDDDLAEVLEGLPPETQRRVVEAVEKRATQKRHATDEADPEWLVSLKAVKRHLRIWEKRKMRLFTSVTVVPLPRATRWRRRAFRISGRFRSLGVMERMIASTRLS